MNDFKKLEKGAKHCMLIHTLAFCAGIMAVLFVIAVFLSLTVSFISDHLAFLWIMFVLLLLMNILYICICPRLRYERYRYRLNEESLEVIDGVIWQTQDIVPIERIQNIQMTQGPLQRHFRVATVTLSTGGGDVSIQYLEKETAEEISASLKKRINEYVRQEKEADHAGE